MVGDRIFWGGSLVTLHPSKTKNRGKLILGSLLPASLLLVWLISTLGTADAGYGTALAQTPPATTPPPASSAGSGSDADALPKGPGKDLVLKACTACHALTMVTSKHATADEWSTTVNDMVNRGATLTDAEEDQVIDYLTKNFKPAASDRKQAPDSAPSAARK